MQVQVNSLPAISQGGPLHCLEALHGLGCSGPDGRWYVVKSAVVHCAGPAQEAQKTRMRGKGPSHRRTESHNQGVETQHLTKTSNFGHLPESPEHPPPDWLELNLGEA